MKNSIREKFSWPPINGEVDMMVFNDRNYVVLGYDEKDVYCCIPDEENGTEFYHFTYDEIDREDTKVYTFKEI